MDIACVTLSKVSELRSEELSCSCRTGIIAASRQRLSTSAPEYPVNEQFLPVTLVNIYIRIDSFFKRINIEITGTYFMHYFQGFRIFIFLVCIVRDSISNRCCS